MQNTERVVMKRNNQSVFIDKFADNVVEYLLWFCFFPEGNFLIFWITSVDCGRKQQPFSDQHSGGWHVIWNEYVTFSTPGSWYFGQKPTKCPKTSP